MRILLIMICSCIAVLLVSSAIAHEGHKSITTKGVAIDAQGRLILQAQAREAIGLETGEVDIGEIRNALSAPGELVPAFKAISFAGSMVEGLVTQIYVRPGQFVKAGEPLAMIQSIELESLQRQLISETIRLNLVEQDLKRAHQLGKTIISGKDAKLIESESKSVQVSITSLVQKMRALGVDSETIKGVQNSSVIVSAFPLLAPQSGFIAELQIRLGSHVDPSKHLIEIQDTRRLLVDIKIPEDRIRMIHKWQPIRMNFRESSKSYISKIHAVLLSLDADDGMFHAFAFIDNSKGYLHPGMFGKVEVEISNVPDAFVIPEAAIVIDGAERYCFVEVEEGVYNFQNLVLGLKEGDRVQVIDGVYPGDRVITDGNHELAALFVQGVLRVSEEATRNIGLRTEEIDFQAINKTTRVNGIVVPLPDRRANGVSRVSGRVYSIHSTLADHVDAGDVLAEIHSMDLVDVQLSLIQTDVRLRFTEEQVEFVRGLTVSKMSSRKELLRIETELRELESRFESLRRTLRLMGLQDHEIDNVLRTKQVVPVVSIRAPISGYVTQQNVSIGRVVDAGEPLYEITDLSVVSAEAVLFAPDVYRVLDRQEVKSIIFRTVAYPDREWLAEIEIFHPSLAGDDKTLRVWTDVKNEDHSLLPGMRLDVHIVTGKSETKEIAIPLRALLDVGDKRYAFVKEGDLFRRIEVITGLEDAHFAQVIDGLFPGDLVVVDAVNELNNAFSAVR